MEKGGTDTWLRGRSDKWRVGEQVGDTAIKWQCSRCTVGRGPAGAPCPSCGEIIYVRCLQCGHDEALPGQPCARCGEPVQDSLDYKARAYIQIFRGALGATSLLVLALLLRGWLKAALVVGVLGGLVVVIVLMAMVKVGLEAGLGGDGDGVT